MSTPKEDEAAQALRDSYAKEKQQIEMGEGARLVLHDMLKCELPDAVAKGIERAMTPERAHEFADIFLDAVQAKWNERVDQVSGKMVRTFSVRFVMFVCFGSIVYAVGGWTGLAAFAKWAFGAVGGE